MPEDTPRLAGVSFEAYHIYVIVDERSRIGFGPEAIGELAELLPVSLKPCLRLFGQACVPLIDKVFPSI
jgi:hypothetical protein